MKFGSLGPRATKIHIRNGIVTLVALVLWWGSATLLIESNYGKYSFWLSLPFWLIAVTISLSMYGIGSLGKEFEDAIKEDKKEEKETLKSKQPWENKNF